MLLVDEAAARTRVEYDADAVVGGVVGGVGQRMLGGVARKLAGQFFTGMDGRPDAGRRAAAEEPGAAGAGGDVVHPATGPVAAFPIAAPPGQPGTSRAAMALAAGTRRSGRGAERRRARLRDGAPERPAGGR